MKLGVIVRKGERKQDIEMFSRFFRVLIHELPRELPELIDEPSNFLKLPSDFNPDMIVSFADHPDINLELIRQASMRNIGLIIFSGGSRSGSLAQLKKEGDKLGVKVLWEEICCSTPRIEDKRFKEFFEHFGAPEVEVELDGDVIKEVRVLRSAFCGATYFVAEKIKGLKIDEAPTKAGYYTQIFPCMASRGIEGGIHRAARAHKRAVERAIKRAMRG